MIPMVSHEDVKDFIETQLSCWRDAKRNYDALASVRRRNIMLGDMCVGIQWNPGRISSTGADVAAEKIKQRPCFLCSANRPKVQIGYPVLDGWEMLVNPFPIFPVHLTIVSRSHIPQKHVPDDIVDIALKLPGMAVFFNGAAAGASAPDHMHLQAVLKDELPLIRLSETFHSSDNPGLMLSSQFGLKLPFGFISGVVKPDDSGMKTLIAGLHIGGLSSDGSLTDPALVNIFFWMDQMGMLRFIVIPRRAHRPSCYFAEGDKRRMVSPGCIDMAGIIIVPRQNDFMALTVAEIGNIYSDVALAQDILLM